MHKDNGNYKSVHKLKCSVCNSVCAIINMLKLSFKFAEAKQTTCYIEDMKDDLSKYYMNK